MGFEKEVQGAALMQEPQFCGKTFIMKSLTFHMFFQNMKTLINWHDIILCISYF